MAGTTTTATGTVCASRSRSQATVQTQAHVTRRPVGWRATRPHAAMATIPSEMPSDSLRIWVFQRANRAWTAISARRTTAAFAMTRVRINRWAVMHSTANAPQYAAVWPSTIRCELRPNNHTNAGYTIGRGLQ